ncbi:hypothetical protein KKG90_01545 [Candidatus Bipolaricaulota bacterium]|nr:hypothetical protein [Candidatus Bipolaricaulota bacterium]
MIRRWTLQQVARGAFVLLILLCVIPLTVQRLREPPGPSIEIVSASGEVRKVTLSQMKAMSVLTRAGSYENQYGNWRDEGVYSGILLIDLVGNADYSSIDVVAGDGYRITVDPERIQNPDYPMVLAFCMDGADVPAWEDGFRLAILPEDGGVSNEEYGVASAGSYWVMRVVKLISNP